MSEIRDAAARFHLLHRWLPLDRATTARYATTHLKLRFFAWRVPPLYIGKEGNFMDEPGTAMCNPAQDGGRP